MTMGNKACVVPTSEKSAVFVCVLCQIPVGVCCFVLFVALACRVVCGTVG